MYHHHITRAIAQAHAADEYVELAELEAAQAAFAHVLR